MIRAPLISNVGESKCGNQYLPFLLLLSLLFPVTIFAGTSSQTVSMSFEECLARKETVISQLGISPGNIIPVVNTNIMTMTKLCTVDGSVIVTCSKPDKKMVITQSTTLCR
jgi:hypothetical protein